ncbi:MAG: hypothetical protein ABSA06_02390, partial [Geobacteraceae bacterium]
MNATSREPVMIDVDSLPGRNLEENLSCAVYLINRLIRRNDGENRFAFTSRTVASVARPA